MAENSNYLLGHNISCNIDMIHEFSAGVNSLFMNAQDILNEGKGILNTISGIMGSIPGEALHGGLSDSIRDCLSRMEMCDMGMEGFVLVRKANSYVDNLYGADSSHAEKVRGCAGYFQSLIWQNVQMHMIGENGKGIPSILQIIRSLKLNGSIDSRNVDNEEEEFQRKLDQLNRYSDSYTHVQDPRGREYYQRKMNEYFHAEIQPVLSQRIVTANNITSKYIKEEADITADKVFFSWNSVLNITKYCGNVITYQNDYGNFKEDIDVIMEDIKQGSNDNIEKMIISIQKVNANYCYDTLPRNGTRYKELEKILDLIIQMEVSDRDYTKDRGIKVQYANDGYITIGDGITIKTKEQAEAYGFRIWGKHSEKEIRAEIARQIEDYGDNLDNPAILSEEEAKRLARVELNTAREKAIGFADERGVVLSQNELDALSSVLFNGNKIYDQDSLSYQFLNGDEGSALAVLHKAEENGWYGDNVGLLRRRLMEFNVFYKDDYDFYEADEMSKLQKITGYSN